MKLPKHSQKKTHNHTNEQLGYRAAILVATAGLFTLLWIYRDTALANAKFGYIGIFVVNFVSSATILFPLPGIASVFLGAAIWNPVLIGIVSALGATCGELFGYLIGYGGKGFLPSKTKQHRYFYTIERYFHTAGFVTIMLYSALPLPLFDVVGVLAGTLNYPVWKFALATLLGRIVKHTLIALAGYKMLPE